MADFLLKEDGGYLLKEDTGLIILEDIGGWEEAPRVVSAWTEVLRKE